VEGSHPARPVRSPDRRAVTAPSLTTTQALTARQTAILQATADGDSPDEIADALFMTRTAVSSTLYYVRIKLRATTTPNAVAEGFRRKIIQ